MSKDQGRSFLDAMFSGGLPHADDKDMDRAVRAKGMQAADLWSLMVAWIADPVRTPSPRINALGLLGWKLCGSNTASLSMTTMVSTPTFLVASKPPRMVGVIMVPPNFVELATADPVGHAVGFSRVRQQPGPRLLELPRLRPREDHGSR